MNKLSTSLLAVLGLVGSAFAGHEMVSSKEYKAPVPVPCFNDREWQFDVFGAFTDGNRPHAGPVKEHGWGGGIGINYFFTRNIGIGVDATWLYARDNNGDEGGTLGDGDNGDNDDNDHTTIHNFSGSIIFRFPNDSSCLAPYLFVGGGFHVDGEQWASAHAGGGIEYRIVPQRIGLFTDARWTFFGDRFGAGDQNNITARAGVRFVF